MNYLQLQFRAPEIDLVPGHVLIRAKVPAEFYCQRGVYELNKEIFIVLKYLSAKVLSSWT